MNLSANQFELSFHKQDGKTFVVVSVFPGTATPYYVLLKGHRDAYIRIGNESVKAGSIDLKRLVLKGSQRDWDSLPSGHKRTTFAFETLRAEYFARTSLEFADGDFESFGLVMPDGTLTNAGALLADKSPVRHSRVFCTRRNGLTKSNGTMEALDDDEFSGGLLSLLESDKGFVRTNTRTKWRKSDKGEGRINYPEYPSRAVEEAITNALIHRDYLITGSEVHIDIFQRLDLMERRGSGFGKILDSYAFEAAKQGIDLSPSFSSGASEFYVILPNLNYGRNLLVADSADSMDSEMPQSNLPPNVQGRHAKVIVRAIKADASITILEMRRKTKLSQSGVYKVLTALKNANVIRHVGPDKGGHWEVIANMNEIQEVGNAQ